MNLFEPMWAKYYAPKLTKHELNQFKKAEARGASLLLTNIIQKQSYDADAGRYIAVDYEKAVEGRSHFTSVNLKHGQASWEHQCFFTNALRIAHRNDHDFRHPSERVVIGPHHVLTFEFDSKNIAFFQHQLSWFRSSRKPLDSPIGKLVGHLRFRYADFVGLNVTYSGNKSFHYHFVIATSLVTGSVLEPTSVRTGFQMAWDRLHEEFVNFAVLGVPPTERPDPALRQPEAYRRLPNGMRLNDNEAHFFGVPVGDVLPQVVMWEHLKLDRQGKGDATLLVPADFSMNFSPLGGAQRNTTTPVATPIEAGEETYCASKLAAMFDGANQWPMFAGFDRSQGDLRAHFFNSPSDKNPKSIMRSDFKTVMIQGNNPLGLTNDVEAGGVLMPRLQRPLGEMMDIWAVEYQQQHLAPGGRARTLLEQQFADAAKDRASAVAALGTVINGLVADDITRPNVQMLSAPEGISKTRTLIANTPHYHRLLAGSGLPTWIMFASPTYEGAKQKAREFAETHGGSATCMFTPVFFESFSEIYRQEFRGKDRDFITHVEAARLGFSSRFDAVTARQPETMERIRRRYADLRASFDQANPVFFTVHPVAQSWGSGADSRLLLSPVMWDQSLDYGARRKAAMAETRLGLLIHDEIDAESIVTAEPAERVAVVRTMIEASDWTSKTPNARKFKIHEQFMRDQKQKDFVSFEDACRIAEVGEAEWDVYVSRPMNEYGPRHGGLDDMYDQAPHRHWCLYARSWASIAAHRTLVLTTEAVPVALAKRAGGWNVVSLDTPLIPKDQVQTIPDRSIRSATAAQHVVTEQAAAKALGQRLFAVGNKLGDAEDVRSHAAAKGSNDYIGKDIIQTMTPMTPDQYAYFQALNAWTGRNDLARLRHIDEFNQTAGRNLGFRAPESGPKAAHTLLINRRLFDNLIPVLSHARYEMVDASSAASRKIVRRRSTGAAKPTMTAPSGVKLQQLREALLKAA
ncbi:hypothetical protein [Brevundimonas diminuta]|uniref:hypothetical protein n=3 Tax=Brevundimonas diminuta TaxID=293 RepID=UPI003D9AB48A